MNVVWTREAQLSFEAILDYLMVFWTEKEVLSFIDTTEKTIFQITKNPEMFKISKYDSQSREGFITKHTTMFYRVIDNYIEIEYFWGNFQNPAKIKKMFSP